MEPKKKINYIVLTLGIFMILASLLNYWMSEDEVSMGIFVFSGMGFVFLGIKDKFEDLRRKRWQRFSTTFFIIAALILLYWIAVAKLRLL